MLDIFNNKVAFLKIKPRIGFLVVILMLIALLFLLIFMYKVKVYDHYQTKGVANCTDTCTITTAIPTNLNFALLAINNRTSTYEIIKKELKVDNKSYETYYEIVLSVSNDFHNNEVVNLNFYYNKQRIITKIKDKMF